MAPWSFTTPRLALRTLQKEDAPALFHIFADAQTMRYTDTEPLETEAQAVREIEGMTQLQAQQHGVRWGLFLLADHTLIGTAGYHKWDKHAQKAEIGYELGSSYWRQGYMTEVFPLLLHYGFVQMKLQRIEALVIPENIPSIGLLQKFNFQREELLRKHCFNQGVYRDEWIFALSRME